MANKTIVKRALSMLLIVVFIFSIALAFVNSEETVKYSELEKEEIDDASNELLKESYADILGYVGNNSRFNTIASTEDIAILNVTIDGKDKRILTKLNKGVLFSQPTVSGDLTTNNLVVLGNISLKGLLYSDVENGFGERRFFGVEESALRYVDEGFSRLISGKANISINPALRGLIGSYTIFLSAERLTKGLYVAEKTGSYFIVKSVNPQSNVAFSWMLRGIRKGYEDEHLNSLYGRKENISITALIDFENGATTVRINGLNNIFRLIANTSNTTVANVIAADNTIENQTNNTISRTSNSNSITTNTILVKVNLSEIGDPTAVLDVNNTVDNGSAFNDNSNAVIDDINTSTSDASQDETPIIEDNAANIIPVEAFNETLQEAVSDSAASDYDLEFTLHSTDEGYAIEQIAFVTGLSLEQARMLVNFVYKEPTGFEDEIIEELQAQKIEGIEKVNGSVIIKLG